MSILKTSNNRQDFKLQLWINKNIYKVLKSIADKQGRTIAELVREGITTVISRYSKNNGKKGEFIHESCKRSK